MNDAIMRHADILHEFWSFLDLQELPSPMCSYFCRVNISLLQRMTYFVRLPFNEDVGLFKEK